MPTYEFKCPRCGESVERKNAADANIPNPMCGDCLVEMVRVFSATPIHFKGSGFYATDKGRK